MLDHRALQCTARYSLSQGFKWRLKGSCSRVELQLGHPLNSVHLYKSVRKWKAEKKELAFDLLESIRRRQFILMQVFFDSC